MNREGQFTLTFNCKPQRFLRSGEYSIPVTSGATVYNPTLFDAKPLIRVYGKGSITVNGETMEWSGSSEYVDIDCDIQDCYYMGANMNNYVTGDFPVLSPGDNVIAFTGSTSVRITPRWWIL
jgi:phage-related protein